MKTYRVSTNVVAWVQAKSKEEALSKLVEEIQQERPDQPEFEAISVEDVYDVSVCKEVTERED